MANKTFKDILNRLEQLRIIDAANDWLELRELRNSLAHEYPTLVSETIEKLNYLRTQIPRIISIFEAVKSAMER